MKVALFQALCLVFILGHLFVPASCRLAIDYTRWVPTDEDVRLHWTDSREGQTSYVYLNSGFTNSEEETVRRNQDIVLSKFIYRTSGVIQSEWIKTIGCPSTSCQPGALFMLHEYDKTKVFATWADLGNQDVYMAEMNEEDGSVIQVSSVSVIGMEKLMTFPLQQSFAIVAVDDVEGKFNSFIVSTSLEIQYQFEELNWENGVSFVPEEGTDNYFAAVIDDLGIEIFKMDSSSNPIDKKKMKLEDYPTYNGLSLAHKNDILLVSFGLLDEQWGDLETRITGVSLENGYEVGVIFKVDSSIDPEDSGLITQMSTDGNQFAVAHGQDHFWQVMVIADFQPLEKFNAEWGSVSALRFDEEDPDLLHTIGYVESSYSSDKTYFLTQEVGVCQKDYLGRETNPDLSGFKTLSLDAHTIVDEDVGSIVKKDTVSLSVQTKSTDIFITNPEIKLRDEFSTITWIDCNSSMHVYTSFVTLISLFAFF